MRKYDIPKIKIIHFLSEICVASSGETPQRSYINEVGYLETALGSEQHQKRMADFTAIIATNN